MTENAQLSVLDHAIHYASTMGWAVFPCHSITADGFCTCGKPDCKSEGKHPATPNGSKDAAHIVDQIEAWFEQGVEEWNIGIATGSVSNLVVVDIDQDKGADINDLLIPGVDQMIFNTPKVKTGGGLHFYYRLPAGVTVKNSASKLGKFIDVRGDGGYVIGPPSKHVSGKSYELLNPDNKQILDFPKPWLDKLAQSVTPIAPATTGNGANGNGLHVQPSGVYVPEEIRHGSRNASLMSIAGSMRAKGLSEGAIYAALNIENQRICRPPLEDKEVHDIARSVGRYAPATPTDTAEAFVSLLDIKTANESNKIASAAPVPEKLFGDFWKQGQLAILFGESGKGKSILAVQISDSISSGRRISNFDIGVGPQKVLYLDLELSRKQFEIRYSTQAGDLTDNPYVFHDNFFRGEIDYKDYSQSNFEAYLAASIDYEIRQYGIKVLIVDNITYLSKGTEKAQEALPLMKMLKKVKEQFQISILVLAHTPKRDSSRPLSINDLQGSAMLKNFADAIFGLGQSETDAAIRYLIQFKQRDGRDDLYDASNVALCEIEKPFNFLGLNFMGFCDQSKLFSEKSIDPSQVKQKDLPAANFLKELMSKGPVPATEVEAAGRAAGFSKKTLSRVGDTIGIMTTKDKNFTGGWTWQYIDSKTASLQEAMQHASYKVSKGNLGNLGDIGKQDSQDSQERGVCKCGVGGNLGGKCFACGGSFELEM